MLIEVGFLLLGLAAYYFLIYERESASEPAASLEEPEPVKKKQKGKQQGKTDITAKKSRERTVSTNSAADSAVLATHRLLFSSIPTHGEEVLDFAWSTGAKTNAMVPTLPSPPLLIPLIDPPKLTPYQPY
jgi:hypothetical protein